MLGSFNMWYGIFIIACFPCVVLIFIIWIFEEVFKVTWKTVIMVNKDKIAVFHLYHIVKWKYFQLFK